MAELTTLARPYAKAAFEYAREKQSLSAWSQSLQLLSGVVQQERLAGLLDSPTLTAKQKVEAVNKVCGDELDTKGQSFVEVLATNSRLLLLPAIAEIFESLRAQQEKFSDVNVISAFPLDESTEKALSDKLSKTLNSDVSLNTEIDKSLIGGVVIRAGDTVVDSSVRGRLAKLAEKLTH